MLATLSGMEREYIRDRTLEGHESVRKRGKTIGGAGITDDDTFPARRSVRTAVGTLVGARLRRERDQPQEALWKSYNPSGGQPVAGRLWTTYHEGAQTNQPHVL